MARIAVLGGSGFLGSLVVAGLRRAGADVAVASRSSAVKVDVTRPDTFEALAPFDVVVDLSDTVRHPPDAVIGWCLARGKTVIEGTSDAPCVERLAKAHEGTAGRLVLGGGIFTGVSNLLGRSVATGARSLVLGIASSPFSGAGRGTIELMVNALQHPAVRYVDGARVEEPTVRRGAELDFAGVKRPGGYMSFAEAFMLHRSAGVPTVDVLFAPKPSLLLAAFTAMPAWLVRAKWYQSFLRAYFTFLRRVLLRSVASAVELVAIADGARRRWVTTEDGMAAGGVALAAMAEAVARDTSWTGVKCIDDVTQLEPIVARANELAGRPLLVLGGA